MASCEVSYLDTDGLRHKVEVEAESLYEAAVLALRAFKKHECEPGAMRSLEIEVRSSVVYTLTVQKVYDWLNGGAKTPKDGVMKDRLRALLQTSQHQDQYSAHPQLPMGREPLNQCLSSIAHRRASRVKRQNASYERLDDGVQGPNLHYRHHDASTNADNVDYCPSDVSSERRNPIDYRRDVSDQRCDVSCYCRDVINQGRDVSD